MLRPKPEYSAVPRALTHGPVRVWLAEALVASGELEEARSALDSIEQGAVERGESGTLAHCWKVRAQLAEAAGDIAAAKIYYDRSLQRARQLSMLPLCQACGAALAALAAAQGSSVQGNVEV